MCVCLASSPGSHPAFRRLQYEKRSTVSDEKLDESLGSRLMCACTRTLCLDSKEQTLTVLGCVCIYTRRYPRYKID